MNEETQQTLIDTTEPSVTASADSASTKRVKRDPRNAEFVIKYDKGNFGKQEESGTAEIYQLVSVMIGVFAFLTRTRWACWLALFFYYTSSINTASDTRLQHVMTGLSIIVMGFVNMYVKQDVPTKSWSGYFSD